METFGTMTGTKKQSGNMTLGTTIEVYPLLLLRVVIVINNWKYVPTVESAGKL